MITGKTLDELENKLERARQKALKRNPSIEVIEAGHYLVQGSNHKFYECWAGRNADNEFFIACTCRGGIQGLACYHASVVFYKHQAIRALEIRLRRNAEQDNSPYLKPTSDKKPEKVGKIRI